MVLQSLRGREKCEFIMTSKPNVHILVYILINKILWQDSGNYFSPFVSDIKVSGQRCCKNLLNLLLTAFGLPIPTHPYSSLLGNFCNSTPLVREMRLSWLHFDKFSWLFFGLCINFIMDKASSFVLFSCDYDVSYFNNRLILELAPPLK